MSSAALELLLDAYEEALGPTGPNPLHHRLEHALQVTDEQLARLVAMDIPTVIHLDGAPDWMLGDWSLAEVDRDDPGELVWLGRWRDFVDAGLHVASATDAPWTFPDFKLTDDIGRPVDQIAAGMDGRVRSSPETPPWLLDQLLTADQGLRAVTADAAYALGDETRRGHLAPGTLGDVTILSGDVTGAYARRDSGDDGDRHDRRRRGRLLRGWGGLLRDDSLGADRHPSSGRHRPAAMARQSA